MRSLNEAADEHASWILFKNSGVPVQHYNVNSSEDKEQRQNSGK
jgi:hypothetical protein